MPINPKKYSYKEFDNEKNSCGSKIPPPHNFSNGPPLTRSKTMQVETIHKLIKLIGYISLTFSDWPLTSGNKFSVTPIEEMNKEELNVCLKSFYTSARKQHSQFYNNMHENYAHCEQGLHRFPPQFNFYNCTNVQVHNNFSGSG